MRKVYIGLGAAACFALALFLFPRLPGDFMRLAGRTFFPHEEVVAEIPLGIGKVPQSETRLPMGVGIRSEENSDVAAHLKLFISEVMAGTSANSQNEFVELYNPNDAAVSLTNWSIKRRSAAGRESSFVSASRLKGKIIPPFRYFLIARDGGYGSAGVPPDAVWPKSYSLNSGFGALVLYNPTGAVSDTLLWNSIPKDQSVVRASWNASSALVTLPIPTPQNSRQ